MAGHRKKILVFLAVLAVGGGLLAVGGSRSPTTKPTIEKGPQRPSFRGGVPNSKAETRSIFADDPALGRPNESFSRGELLSRTMISVLLVVALGAGALYVSKKFGAKITNSPGRKIHVIETAHLGPRKMVHLIKIGRQKLLVGSTNENITMLADVSRADIEMVAGPEPVQSFREAALAGQ